MLDLHSTLYRIKFDIIIEYLCNIVQVKKMSDEIKTQ